MEKFTIVPQTKIAFIGYVLLLVAKIAAMIYSKDASPMSIFWLAIFVVFSTLGLYVINCTVLGKCNLYAWIIGYVVAIIGVVALISVLTGLKI